MKGARLRWRPGFSSIPSSILAGLGKLSAKNEAPAVGGRGPVLRTEPHAELPDLWNDGVHRNALRAGRIIRRYSERLDDPCRAHADGVAAVVAGG